MTHLYWHAKGRSGRTMADALGLKSNPYPKPARTADRGVA